MAKFFSLVMRWRYVLTSGITEVPDKGAAEALFGVALFDERPWTADFWFGGFDADAQAFFCSGTLMVPSAGEQVIAGGLGIRSSAGIQALARRQPVPNGSVMGHKKAAGAIALDGSINQIITGNVDLRQPEPLRLLVNDDQVGSSSRQERGQPYPHNLPVIVSHYAIANLGGRLHDNLFPPLSRNRR